MSTLLLNRNKHIGGDFLFFINFHCPQLFYCPLPYHCSGVPGCIRLNMINDISGISAMAFLGFWGEGENGAAKIHYKIGRNHHILELNHSSVEHNFSLKRKVKSNNPETISVTVLLIPM